MVNYLASHLVGPKFGDREILSSSPVYAYLSGMLFPVERVDDDDSPLLDDDAVSSDIGAPAPGSSANETWLDTNDETRDLIAATGWVPSSMGLSCVHDGTAVTLIAKGSTYVPTSAIGNPDTARPSESEALNRERNWQRVELPVATVDVPAGGNGHIDIWEGRARLQWRSRPARGNPVLTVALSNLGQVAANTAKRAPELVLFQCEVAVEPVNGELLPYPGDVVVNATPEDRELAYRFRKQSGYAIGHGVGTTWSDSTPVKRVATSSVPREVVPPLSVRDSNDPALRMAWLADTNVDPRETSRELKRYFSEYGDWCAARASDAAAEPLDGQKDIAIGIVAKIREAIVRISEGIELLDHDPIVRRSFQIANQAMHRQSIDGTNSDPHWRPFQLAFFLMALPSTAYPDHEDRELVDLIWFPTGGGKTEAYLGLAAFEAVRRRLTRGYQGGGTSAITRYTMRLLTAQQFQRTARLMCALELLRRELTELHGMPGFTIGLLLGNETTPATFKDAAEQLQTVRAQQTPENPFQIRSCPWCGTSLLPRRRSARDSAYGFVATTKSFAIHCVEPTCDFADQLPVQVVDEAIYADPPTIVVATVDKFARLAWTSSGGSIFGLAGSPFDPPSLVIQDELHLISGPLGTIVGIYEAAIRSLLCWTGKPPKVVASTATIRSAEEQVRALMASRVSVFPPAGLDADDSFFAKTDRARDGRMYVGVMPQAFAPAWSIAQVSARMLIAADAAQLTPSERDSYWTLVLYHNSLRELGRTMTILRDDVRDVLERERQLGGAARVVPSDGVVELTGNVKSHELVEVLERLEVTRDNTAAVDAVAATNILSVGIDVKRLGLMLVNGQPKTTAEYIQATSRVGRDQVSGIVLTLYRSGKARDRSTFEAFKNFHGSFYRFVEPTSLTPWALQARRRALRAALVILVRHGVGLSENDAAGRYDPDSRGVERAIGLLEKHIAIADPREADAIHKELQAASEAWAARTAESTRPLKYQGRLGDEARLLKTFGDPGSGWPTMHSMRSVDRSVRLRPKGEMT